jgi:hypothetical protein
MGLPHKAERRLFIIWVGANSAGWLLGVIAVLLLARLQDLIRVGNAVYGGAGMGFSVGLAQWLVGRKWFGATGGWIWASTVGITAPFLFADLMRIQNLNSFWLIALASVGGLLSGLLQRNRLRPLSPKADWWALVSAVAWVCPALLFELVAVPRHPNNAVEALRNAGSLAFGGVVLGFISGIALPLLLNPQKEPASE